MNNNILKSILSYDIELEDAVKIALQGYSTYLQSKNIPCYLTFNNYLCFLYKDIVGNFVYYAVRNKAKIILVYSYFTREYEFIFASSLIDKEEYFKVLYDGINSLFDEFLKELKEDNSFRSGHEPFNKDFYKEFIKVDK